MVAINFDSEGRIHMLQDDFILRQIREMVHAVMKMLFQVSASELTPEVIEDSTARTTLENLIALTDEGKIDEAENQLYEMTCDGDRQNLEIGLLFYYNLNGKDDDFLEVHNFSREEIMTGIQDLADRYQLSGIAEAFRTEIL
jgi:hypothetical protein